MKTIFTLLLSSLFTLSAMAYDGTRLTVSTLSTQKMFVEVDGRRFNFTGNTVTLTNIRPGVHNVRVLRELKKRGNGVFGIGNKREEVIYSIKASLKNGYHFDILVNRFGKVMIDERRIDYNDDWYTDDDEDYYDRDRNGGYPNDKGHHGRDPQDKDYRDRDDRNYDDRNDRDYNFGRAMNASDFNQAKETLRKEWFENTRLSNAKQFVDRNFFTSQQVKELLLLFTFENNKLDLAKYAYNKAVDKNNYVIVNDVFSFSNSKDELARYIRESR